MAANSNVFFDADSKIFPKIGSDGDFAAILSTIESPSFKLSRKTVDFIFLIVYLLYLAVWENTSHSYNSLVVYRGYVVGKRGE